MEYNEDPEAELFTSRIISANIHKVWEAWINPELLTKRRGPEGFSNTFIDFEPRYKGHRKFVMHGPNGVDYPNESRFEEIRECKVFSFHHIVPPLFFFSATFEDLGDNKTKVNRSMKFRTAGDCQQVKQYAPTANKENLDRLEALLATL